MKKITIDGIDYNLVPIQKPFDFVCKHSCEGFMVGDECFYVWDYTLDIKPFYSTVGRGFSNTKAAYFHNKEDALKWNKEKFGGKVEEKEELEENSVSKISLHTANNGSSIRIVHTNPEFSDINIKAKIVKTEEELLIEEANKRYFVGIKFKSIVPQDRNAIRVVLPFDEQKDNSVKWVFDSYDNNIYAKNGIFTNNYCCSNPYIYKNGKWAEIVEDKKPVFAFEGHEYFEGGDCFFYNKQIYKILSLNVHISLESFINSDECNSKIFPTHELCKEALYEYINDNHPVTRKKYKEIHSKWCDRDKNSIIGYLEFYCEHIINELNK